MLWMDLAVVDGAIAVNPAGQMMAPDHTCNFGWAPTAPPFAATREEDEDDA